MHGLQIGRRRRRRRRLLFYTTARSLIFPRHCALSLLASDFEETFSLLLLIFLSYVGNHLKALSRFSVDSENFSLYSRAKGLR